MVEDTLHGTLPTRAAVFRLSLPQVSDRFFKFLDLLLQLADSDEEFRKLDEGPLDAKRLALLKGGRAEVGAAGLLD
jgi:hypothetical protein